MSRAGAWRLALAALAAGCTAARTEVVLVVSNGGVVIPGDVDQLQLRATDTTAGMPVFDSPMLALCATDGSQVPLCKPLPIVLTLVPGQDHPDDAVRVEADALKNDATALSGSASFNFTRGASLRLDIVLYPRCVGLDCAAQDEVCDSGGTCRPAMLSAFQGEPALDSGVAIDASLVDLAAPISDGSLDGLSLGPGDASSSDLASFAGPDMCVIQPCAMNFRWCGLSCSCARINPPGCMP